MSPDGLRWPQPEEVFLDVSLECFPPKLLGAMISWPLPPGLQLSQGPKWCLG